MKLQVFFFLLLNSFVLIRTAAIQENGVEEADEDVDIDKKKCPPWDKWQSSKCLWPSQEFSSLPKACTDLPKKPEIPPILKQFVKSKQLEVWSLVQGLFKLRGAKQACGYCSRKIRCRQRKGGQWTKGCKFAQGQMVDEECDGTKACEISSILGACPAPIPMPPRRRKPRQLDMDSDDRIQIDSNLLGDKNMEIEVGKNASQGPPLWHCMRNKDGSKCLCCCGWYFPDAKTGKCKNIRPNDTNDEDDDQIWNWSGLVDIADLQYPFGYDSAVGDGIIEQIEAPPLDIESQAVDTDDQGEVTDQMPDPNLNPLPDSTSDQIAAPVTVEWKKEAKKPLHETNEI